MPEISIKIILFFIVLIIILILLLRYYFFKYMELKHKYKSASVIHGQNIEEVVPFSKYFNYDYRQFKFLGQPVEGIVFGDDKISFIEIKTGQSQLSDKQKNIKELVENKKVYWEEIRIWKKKIGKKDVRD